METPTPLESSDDRAPAPIGTDRAAILAAYRTPGRRYRSDESGDVFEHPAHDRCTCARRIYVTASGRLMWIEEDDDPRYRETMQAEYNSRWYR